LQQLKQCSSAAAFHVLEDGAAQQFKSKEIEAVSTPMLLLAALVVQWHGRSCLHASFNLMTTLLFKVLPDFEHTPHHSAQVIVS
jgi:hypothetical protein